MGHRRWLPRWRFQPAENLMDAFRLLEGAAPAEYSMSGGSDGGFLRGFCLDVIIRKMVTASAPIQRSPVNPRLGLRIDSPHRLGTTMTQHLRPPPLDLTAGIADRNALVINRLIEKRVVPWI